MTRTLLLLRHAKSDYPPGVRDHDRPLAPRGEREAVLAGRWLDTHGGLIDLAVVSSATRTQQTWGLVGAELEHQPPRHDEPRVYEAMTSDLLDVVRETDDAVSTLLVVGHNPGLEDLADLLAGSARGDSAARMRAKFPTSAIAVLELPTQWSEAGAGCAVLLDFVVPRA